MFSLNRKIEEIREKPEYIRIRYVWGMVAVSMLLIITIWVFSVRENFRNIDIRSDNLKEIQQGFQNLGSGLPEANPLSEGETLQEEIGNPESGAGSISDLNPDQIEE